MSGTCQHAGDLLLELFKLVQSGMIYQLDLPDVARGDVPNADSRCSQAGDRSINVTTRLVNAPADGQTLSQEWQAFAYDLFVSGTLLPSIESALQSQGVLYPSCASALALAHTTPPPSRPCPSFAVFTPAAHTSTPEVCSACLCMHMS